MTFAELLMEKLYRNKNSSKTSGNNCEIESMEDGLPWSACAPKMTWLKSRWRSDPCYAAHGVNDTVCSWYDYLARVEGHCPQKGNVEPKRALKSKSLLIFRDKNFIKFYRSIRTSENFSNRVGPPIWQR